MYPEEEEFDRHSISAAAAEAVWKQPNTLAAKASGVDWMPLTVADKSGWNRADNAAAILLTKHQ